MISTGNDYNHTVIELFYEQVKKTPENIAISDNGIELTYLALNEKSNQFASWLKEQGIKSDDFVGLFVVSGINFIVSILAIIKAGAAYLPLDVLAPQKRLNQIVEDANLKLLITDEEFSLSFEKELFPIHLVKSIYLKLNHYPVNNHKCNRFLKKPIYMMYTSGSTGKPKGVIILHQAVVNLAKIENTINLKTGDTIAQFSNVAFDGSIIEIWTALLNGAKLVILSNEIKLDPNKLKSFIKEHLIRYLFLPTSFFHQLMDTIPQVFDEIKSIIFGGEQINPNLIKKFITYRESNKLPVTLINCYGPTESTVYACCQKINENSLLDEESLSSIGKPIKNVKVYVLDENKNPTSEGELYISGINLALSYHNDPEQTQEKFISNPFCQDEPYQRLYKTGDKVRILPSGDLLFLGRLDDQVKVGGYRVHLNEIENQLIKYPIISLAAVTAEKSGGLHQILTAFVVSNTDETLDTDLIRHFLSETLPPYMLPAKYCLIQELPLTSVGKVDKIKLAHMPHIELSSHHNHDVSDIADKIKKIWQNLLNRRSIDIHKNLFELGANSLLLADACFRINELLHGNLQVSTLIAYPTVHKLANYLEGKVEQNTERKTSFSNSSDVAIIGMSCRFPEAKSLDEFWVNLCQGKDCLKRFTKDELEASSNKHFIPVRGIVSDVDQFDASFFGFSPIDASLTDPQQRIFLECAWEALEHAGIVPSKLGSKLISVFAGMNDSSYLQENLLKNNWVVKEYDRFHQRIGTSTGMLSTQVSYRLNLKGRSLNINTACSTGLVTVAEACKDLITNQSDIALAGAVSIVVPEAGGYIYQEGSIESADGQCRPFSRDANGTVFSNGVGIVILKRLDEAIADGDRIYAVIKGAGVNNDGSDKLGYIAPSTRGQMDCIKEALRQAKLSPKDIGYIEAHGTATRLGDAVELDAIKSIYDEQSNKKQFCALGSVKGNIGHTDVAAGMAGLIKTALCLYHEKIPPTLHCQAINPDLKLEGSSFYINTNLMDWKRGEARFAGVSAFGVGGTNAHLILGESPKTLSTYSSSQEQLIVLSAKTENALGELKQKIICNLDKPSEENVITNLSDIAYTLQQRRETFQWRCYSVGNTRQEVIENLAKSQSHLVNKEKNRIVFMFPGQGSQYHDMASQLMEIPYFASLFNEGMNLATSYLNCNLQEILNNPLDTRIHQTEYAQPALFIIEYALAKLLMQLGIIPSALIGHSLGEYVAASLSGVFSFEEGLSLVCQRGLLMSSLPTGEMLAIECSLEEFEIYTKSFQVELALHNSISHCVASGESDEIAKLVTHLSYLDVKFQKLEVSHAFHSQTMEAIEDSFKALFSTITLSSPQIPILSNVTGDWLLESEAINPDYWYQHLRYTVQLCKGFQRLKPDDSYLFVEVGTGQAMSAFLKGTIPQKETNIKVFTPLPNHKGHISDLHALLNTIGQLWQQGLPINWSLLHDEIRNHVPLPTYPFQRQRYWIEPDKTSQPLNLEPKLYKPVWSHQKLNRDRFSFSTNILDKHSWIIFKDEIGLGNQLIELLQSYEIKPFIVEQNSTFEVTGKQFKINPREKAHYLKLFQLIKNDIKNPILLHGYSCTKIEEDLLEAGEIDRQLHLSFYSLLFLAQAYLEEIGDRVPLKCALITSGTEQILGNEAISPINGSLVGACRVITQEHALLKFRLIDISLNTDESINNNLANTIIHSCLNEVWDEDNALHAYRNGLQWQSSHMEIKEPAIINRFKDKGVYLFTGGLGGIALALCEVIAKEVINPTFILLSRRAIPLESEWAKILQTPIHPFYNQISSLKKLQALGASFIYNQVDIEDSVALSSVIDLTQEKLGINGLIHAAGLPGGGLVQLKSKERADEILSPKLKGTYHLAKALKGIKTDFVILMSSIASLIGEPGQIDYCAANACLDAFAQSSLFNTSFLMSLNWNTWRDVGMAIEADKPQGVSFLNREDDISREEGQRLFLQAMKTNYSNIAVSNNGLLPYSKRNIANHNPSVLSQVKIARHDLNVNNLFQAPQTSFEKSLALLWQQDLGIEKISIHDDFFDLGGHSLKALRLIEKMNHFFQTKLKINQLYETPTISKLSKILESDMGQQEEIIVPLKQENENLPSIFLCHPASGMIYCFNSLVSQCKLPVSIYGLQDPSATAGHLLYDSVSSMADAYLNSIKKIQPSGPYYLIGYSFGATVLHEVVHKLQQQKEEIALLVMIEGWALFSEHQYDKTHFKNRMLTYHKDLPTYLVELAWDRMKLLLSHTPSKIIQDMILFKASELFEDYQAIEHPFNGWSNFNTGKIVYYRLDANHETILNPKNSQIILSTLEKHYALG